MKIQPWVLSSNRDMTLSPFSNRDTTLSPFPKYKLKWRYNLVLSSNRDMTLSPFSNRIQPWVLFLNNIFCWFAWSLILARCMLDAWQCMKNFLLYYFWRMYTWMYEVWFIFSLFLKNAYMNAWSLIYFFCLKNVYMNAWNVIFFLRMYIWMHEIWFLWRMHIKMYEICLNMNFLILSFFSRM